MTLKQEMQKSNEKHGNFKGQAGSFGKKINRKVMGMIQRAEKEYTDLIQKKQSLEDDRNKIEEVIATLGRQEEDLPLKKHGLK